MSQTGDHTTGYDDANTITLHFPYVEFCPHCSEIMVASFLDDTQTTCVEKWFCPRCGYSLEKLKVYP